jgi:inhibitor of cysteine peptidase
MNSQSTLIIAAALVLSACSTGTGESPATPVAPIGDVQPLRNGLTTLSVGQTLKIALPGNVTTGYQWQVAETYAEVLSPDSPFGGEVTDPHAPGMVGVGGTSAWRFRAVRPGTVTLTFTYARSWERDTPPAETATYTITVR